MKRFLWNLVVGLLVGSSAISTCWAGYLDGSTLNKFIEATDRVGRGNAQPADFYDAARAVGYVEGVVDALDGFMICVPAEVRAKQLVAMVGKYLADHPSEWHLTANSVVWSALKTTFPCKKE